MTTTLSEIQQSFYSRSFDAASIRWWLVGLGIIIAFLLVYLAVKAFLAGRVKYSPYGYIADPKMIRNILHAADEQRRYFEVQMQHRPDSNHPMLRCSAGAIELDTFTLELSGLNLSRQWLKREITVFFSIIVEKEYTYYTFPASIQAISLPWQGMCHLTLPMPTSLENRQKRSFLRLTPPREFFPGAAIWYDGHFPDQVNKTDISQWPRPKLIFIPGKLEQFKIIDLSAGGARISVPGRVAKLIQLQLSMGECLILVLDLFDPEQGERLRLWTECRVQNVWVEHPSRDVQAGLQFLAWAKACKTDQEGVHPVADIEWFKLSASNEVDPIGNWIIHRHLEMFRERAGYIQTA